MSMSEYGEAWQDGYDDGVRAGKRMTRTERALVKAAEKWGQAKPCDPLSYGPACPKCQAMERLKTAIAAHIKALAKSKQKKGRK
jgi:hypothetical protein